MGNVCCHHCCCHHGTRIEYGSWEQIITQMGAYPVSGKWWMAVIEAIRSFPSEELWTTMDIKPMAKKKEEGSCTGSVIRKAVDLGLVRVEGVLHRGKSHVRLYRTVAP